MTTIQILLFTHCCKCVSDKQKCWFTHKKECRGTNKYIRIWAVSESWWCSAFAWVIRVMMVGIMKNLSNTRTKREHKWQKKRLYFILGDYKFQSTDYVLCHTGIDLCLGATSEWQRMYALSCRQSLFFFRHTKQNFTLHRGQTMLLHCFSLCSTRIPQVGQARMQGQPLTPFTSLKTMSGQFFNMSRGSGQPSLSQRSERGAGPFHSLKHCQQNL